MKKIRGGAGAGRGDNPHHKAGLGGGLDDIFTETEKQKLKLDLQASSMYDDKTKAEARALYDSREFGSEGSDSFPEGSRYDEGDPDAELTADEQRQEDRWANRSNDFEMGNEYDGD